MPRGVHLPSGQRVTVLGVRDNWGDWEYEVQFVDGPHTHWRVDTIDVCPCSYAQKHEYVRSRWANGCDIDWNESWRCEFCGAGHWFPHEKCGCGWEAKGMKMKGL